MSKKEVTPDPSLLPPNREDEKRKKCQNILAFLYSATSSENRLRINSSDFFEEQIILAQYFTDLYKLLNVYQELNRRERADATKALLNDLEPDVKKEFIVNEDAEPDLITTIRRQESFVYNRPFVFTTSIGYTKDGEIAKISHTYYANQNNPIVVVIIPTYGENKKVQSFSFEYRDRDEITHFEIPGIQTHKDIGKFFFPRNKQYNIEQHVANKPFQAISEAIPTKSGIHFDSWKELRKGLITYARGVSNQDGTTPLQREGGHFEASYGFNPFQVSKKMNTDIYRQKRDQLASEFMIDEENAELLQLATRIYSKGWVIRMLGFASPEEIEKQLNQTKFIGISDKAKKNFDAFIYQIQLLYDKLDPTEKWIDDTFASKPEGKRNFDYNDFYGTHENNFLKSICEITYNEKDGSYDLFINACNETNDQTESDLAEKLGKDRIFVNMKQRFALPQMQGFSVYDLTNLLKRCSVDVKDETIFLAHAYGIIRMIKPHKNTQADRYELGENFDKDTYTFTYIDFQSGYRCVSPNIPPITFELEGFKVDIHLKPQSSTRIRGDYQPLRNPQTRPYDGFERYGSYYKPIFVVQDLPMLQDVNKKPYITVSVSPLSHSQDSSECEKILQKISQALQNPQ